MRWFRQRRIFGAHAALFALLVQFTLAFGHIHLGQANSTVNVALSTSAPITPDQDNSTDGTCAICVTVHMTGSAQATAPPVLLLPVTYRVAAPSLSSKTLCDDPRCYELRSRGPPQA